MLKSLSKQRLVFILFLLASFLLIFGIRLQLIQEIASPLPYWDDWGMGSFLYTSLTEGLALEHIFALSNEHRLIFNKLLSLWVFSENDQQWDPVNMMVVNAFIWSVSGIIVLTILSRLEDDSHRVLICALVLFLFVFPVSLVNIVWGIQTHTYTMILFSIVGIWLVLSTPYSSKWWLGLVALACAPLTLAGGSFVVIAVIFFMLLWVLLGFDKWHAVRPTIVSCVIISVLAMFSILSQDGKNIYQSMTLSDSVISFLKTMSWPAARSIWPAFVFMLPPLLLFIQLIKNNQAPDLLTRFLLTVFGFVGLLALAISYARGAGALGPAPRYYEFLCLLSISSAGCLVLLQMKSVWSENFKRGLTALWASTFIYGAFGLYDSLLITLKERQELIPIQSGHVNDYLNTRDPEALLDKPFRYIPFPHGEVLADSLDQMNEAEMLPYELQKPNFVSWSGDITMGDIQSSAFVQNGTIIASTKELAVDYDGEPVVGSYRPKLGGNKATGTFKSEVFRIIRPYLAVPTMGYLGYPDLSLKLVDVGSKEEFDIVPSELHAKYAESWRTVILPIPRGYYQLEATDQNETLWFAFGTPRSVGRFSYFSKKMIEAGSDIWKFGAFLLILFLCMFSGAELRLQPMARES
ncbi:MAG: hypothetical protein AAF197_04600 [Pseudomonadota bacterium]